jgi:hypothetical protein
MIDNITLEYLVVQKPGNIVTDMDGEKVMMNILNSKYYNLGNNGGRIWELIKAPMSIHELIETLMNEYEVEQSICEEHVLTFLSHLSSEGLIDWSK